MLEVILLGPLSGELTVDPMHLSQLYNKCQEKFTIHIFQALISFDFDPNQEGHESSCQAFRLACNRGAA